jgi:hypothetical protein
MKRLIMLANPVRTSAPDSRAPAGHGGGSAIYSRTCAIAACAAISIVVDM